MRTRGTRLAAVLAVVASLLVTGCTGGDGRPAERTVVASTTWVAALARAAGATDVTVLAPANVERPWAYVPTDDDLAPASSARYLLYAESDTFAAALTAAAGKGTEVVAVRLTNTPAVVRSEVTRLAGLLGTAPQAQAWLSTFDNEYATLSGHLRDIAPIPPLTAVADAATAYWAEFAGLRVIGTYGPQPAGPERLAELTAARPGILLADAHTPGSAPTIPGARRVDLINYPGPDLDLLSVFRANTDRLTHAFAS